MESIPRTPPTILRKHHPQLRGDESFFQFPAPTQASVDDLQRLINVRKLERYMLLDSKITVESETARGLKYLKEYLAGLPLGGDLPVTELQPVDDLALLAANAFVMVWTLNRSEEALYQAITVLEYGLSKSRMSFQMRIMLVRIYRILGGCVWFVIIELLILCIRRTLTCPGALPPDECQASSERHIVPSHSYSRFDIFACCHWGPNIPFRMPRV